MNAIFSFRLQCRRMMWKVVGVLVLGLGALTPAWSADGIVYGGSFPAATPAGLSATSLAINGENRSVLVYRPSGAVPQPLLILFSGTGGTLDYNIADEIGRDALRAFADRENVIVAVPIQRVMSRGDWDNHSAGTPYWETALDESTASAASFDPNSNPDLLLTRAIIKEAGSAYGADLTRVYLNGFSNGAFFSYFAAATLGSRVAAFAETGGGLVLSQTTAGEPSPCVVAATPAAAGEVRGCAAAGWAAGTCVTPGAIPRPLDPNAAARVPPGFMEANDDDTTVPFAHTCNLANALPASPAYQVRIVHSGLGHAMNAGYLDNSWNFMKNFRLDDADRIFNWAESVYGPYFSPAGPASQNGYGYYYRYYPTTNSYLGAREGRGYYLLPGSDVVDAGLLADFLGQAAAAGF